jgi:PAS domain S-box-containing protein
MNQMFVAADDLLHQEETIMQERSQALARARNNLKFIIFLAVTVNIFLAVLLALYFNRGTSRRLNVLMDNVVRLGAHQQLNEPQQGDDEIARLDQVFHEMALALANAQKRERAIVDNAVDVICSVEPDGRITAVNPAATRIWGYSTDDLIGSRLSLIISPDDIDATIVALRKSIDEQSAVGFENRIRRKNGSLVDMLWSAYWSVDEGAIVCVAHDITERKELDRMKQEFVAVVSHDLRTPLTSVQGFLSLLSIGAYNELSDGGKQSLAVAEAGIERLVGLVNDLLDLEKMEAGHMEVRPARLKVSDLVKRAIETMEQSARAQLVILQSFVSYEVSDIFADDARLMQVMVNLLSNAIKYAPSGSTVSVEASESEEFVEIRVIDRGRGVPKDLRTVIFEKFRQADISDERVRGGTGLGLAICKAIVERHGGKIGVRDANSGKDVRQSPSEPGSCFWFLVPKFQEVSKFSETSKSRLE